MAWAWFLHIPIEIQDSIWAVVAPWPSNIFGAHGFRKASQVVAVAEEDRDLVEDDEPLERASHSAQPHS